MATRIEGFDATIPPGALPAAPTVTPLAFQDAYVERIEIVVPDGPSGLMGFAIFYGSQQVIPFKAGQWIIANGETISWNVTDYPTGGQWALRGYNIDAFPHTLHLRFLLRELAAQPVAARLPALVTPAGGV